MEDIEKIYTGLRQHWGSIKELSLRHGCSLEWVRLVFKGRYKDPDLILQAAQLYKELETARTKKLRTAGRIAAQATAG